MAVQWQPARVRPSESCGLHLDEGVKGWTAAHKGVFGAMQELYVVVLVLERRGRDFWVVLVPTKSSRICYNVNWIGFILPARLILVDHCPPAGFRVACEGSSRQFW